MDKFTFDTDSLYYTTIEERILNYYDLGNGDSSNFMELEKGIHSGYHISATKGIIEFSSIIGMKKDNTYSVTINPIKIVREK